MKSIDLVTFDGDFYVNSRARQLKPEEMFYVRVKSLVDLPDNIVSLVMEAATLSSNVILSIPAEDFANTELTAQYFELGIRGFALRLSHNVDKWLKHEGIGQFNSGDRDIINLYHQYRGLLPEGKELVVEFQVGDDLRVLAPTITGIYAMGAKWVVLNPEGEPTPERTGKYREFFEYLKIRGCTKLNVYFPFWNGKFREWDIKTQNTFSGLEFVHIDISNRCTHSCVFCGLYGAEAIDDIKARGGGKIPEELNRHMKQEIDTEKCLKIVNSLPWSVRSVQFGGFGDPLMHEDAVNFIAAARKRGFRVEVLSNMEYLKDEDIYRLHDLGGKNFHDLHFIANISAGDPELYVKTRPRQTAKNFEKVVHNISLFTKLRKENYENGVNFTLMCVVTTINCEHLLEVAQLAHKIGARRIWFKPMEIHHSTHSKYVPQNTKAMAKSLSDAIAFAEGHMIQVVQKDYCLEIIRRHSGETANV